MCITYTPRRAPIYHYGREGSLPLSPRIPHYPPVENATVEATPSPTRSKPKPRGPLESGGCPRLRLDRRAGRAKEERRTRERQSSVGRSCAWFDLRLPVQLLHLRILIPRRRSEVAESPEIGILSQRADQNRVDLFGGNITTRKRERQRIHHLVLGRNAHSPQFKSQPPTLLLAYLPSLTAASCQLLDRFLSDPTAYGVSLAFAESEQQLEAAFLPWCSVVGSAFTGPSRSHSTGSIAPSSFIKQASKQIFTFEKRRSLEILDVNSTSPSPTRGWSSGNPVTKAFRRLSLSRGSTPSRPMGGDNSSTSSLMSDTVHSSDYHTSSPPSKLNSDGPPVLTLRHLNSGEFPDDTDRQRDLYPHDSRRYLSCLEANGSREPSRIRSFRDLAILPTQRVVRYVLLFRGTGLLSNCVHVPLVLSIVDRPSC